LAVLPAELSDELEQLAYKKQLSTKYTKKHEEKRNIVQS